MQSDRKRISQLIVFFILIFGGSAFALFPYDTTTPPNLSSIPMYDTTATDTSNRTVQPPPPVKLHPVHRMYDNHKQILLATGMMVFIALILGSTQMWNPD